MRRMTRPASALALALAAVLALASCGGSGDELLAGETADEITQNLDLVEELADARDCVGAEEATAAVAGQVEELQVDPRLQEALEEGVDKLSEAVSDCQETEEEAPEEAIETIEEPEGEEDERQKPSRDKKEGDAPAEEREPTTPQNDGGDGGEETEPTEPESESGGVSPAAPAEGS